MTQQQAVNFLPEDYVEKRSAQRSAIVFIGLFLAVMSGIVGTYLYLDRQRAGLTGELDRINRELDARSKESADHKELLAQKDQLCSKFETCVQLTEKVERSKLLKALLQDTVPEGVRFTFLELKTKEVAGPPAPTSLQQAKRQMEGQPVVEQPKAPPPEVSVDLMGLAPSHEHVALYMDHLTKLRLIMQPKPLFSEEYRKNPDDPALRRFRIEMRVNPDADTRTDRADAGGAFKAQ